MFHGDARPILDRIKPQAHFRNLVGFPVGLTPLNQNFVSSFPGKDSPDLDVALDDPAAFPGFKPHSSP
jgi:hypothetical protein